MVGSEGFSGLEAWPVDAIECQGGDPVFIIVLMMVVFPHGSGLCGQAALLLIFEKIDAEGDFKGPVCFSEQHQAASLDQVLKALCWSGRHLIAKTVEAIVNQGLIDCFASVPVKGELNLLERNVQVLGHFFEGKGSAIVSREIPYDLQNHFVVLQMVYWAGMCVGFDDSLGHSCPLF